MNTQAHYALQFGQIFTVFFIMLGPLRLTGPFALATVGLSTSERRTLSLKSGLIALLALILSGFIGSFVMGKWQIDPATLLLTVGILFLISAIRPILHPTEKALPPSIESGPVDVAMKLIISRQGLSAVIVMFAISQTRERFLTIIGALALIIAVDILSMMFTKTGDQNKQNFFSQLLKSLLGTLQLALALQIIYVGLQKLEVI